MSGWVILARYCCTFRATCSSLLLVLELVLLSPQAARPRVHPVAEQLLSEGAAVLLLLDVGCCHSCWSPLVSQPLLWPALLVHTVAAT